MGACYTHLHSGCVGGVRRGEAHGGLGALELGDLLLELDVQRVRARQRAVPRAQPIPLDRLLRGDLEARLLGKAEVVRAAEVEVRLAADLEPGALARVDHARRDLVRLRRAEPLPKLGGGGHLCPRYS